jgi:hypothetical protein
MTKLDADEKELVESVEREWKSAAGGKRERARYALSAKATFRKDRKAHRRCRSPPTGALNRAELISSATAVHAVFSGFIERPLAT